MELMGKIWINLDLKFNLNVYKSTFHKTMSIFIDFIGRLKMNEFIFHLPSFGEGREREFFTFYTTEELLDNPGVKRWSKNLFGENKPFYQYSIADGSLMAEFCEGTEWFVIGHIKNPNDVLLPKWKPKR